jgi:hypothetical protein
MWRIWPVSETFWLISLAQRFLPNRVWLEFKTLLKQPRKNKETGLLGFPVVITAKAMRLAELPERLCRLRRRV